MIEIVPTDDLVVIRELLLEYAAGTALDLCFQNFDEELQTLDSFYEVVLVAREGAAVMGCVALRRIDTATAEMKRLYVRSPFRGRTIGRLLAQRITGEARRRGYTRMRLDTLPDMAAAIALYESLGFRDIAAYRYNPVEGTRYMELEL